MARVAGDRIQQVGEDPFVDLMAGACGQVDKTDAALPGGPGPTNLTRGFNAQARKSQVEAQPDALFRLQRSNRLNGHTFVAEIADDSAVGLIERDVR